MKKTICEIMVILLLTSMLTLAFNIQEAETSEPPATEWSRTYGGSNNDHGKSVVETSDGGYAIAGETGSFGAGGVDFWLVKTYANGTMQWSQTYGGTSDDDCNSIVETSDGGYALAGGTNSFGAGLADMWLVKTYANGTMQWSQTYGRSNVDYCFCLQQTSDGGYILVGKTKSFGAGQRDIWLVKTYANGSMQWSRTYGGSLDDDGFSVVQVGDGGYVIAGSTSSTSDGRWDALLIKTYANGTMEWNQTYGDTGSDESARSVVQTADGGYALAGAVDDPHYSDKDDFWLVKTDANGNMQWNKTYGETNWEYALDSIQTSDGGYAITGATNSFGAGSQDFWLVKTDSSGNHQWNQTYGGTDFEQAYSVVQTSDGGYALAGRTNSFGAGGADFWLIKLASPKIPATIDIDPDTLNLKSNGQWITAYVTLPEGYSVEDIDVASVELIHNEVVVEAADWGEVQDSVLMVKFDRATLRDYLGEVDVDDGDKFYDITLTVKGNVAGTPFEGSDTITVKRK